MRNLWAIASMGLGVLLACVSEPFFSCQDDAACAEFGEQGQCESNFYCTFPDPICQTGRRYHERAGDDLGGECFGPDGATTTAAGSSSGAADSGSSSTSTSTSTTTTTSTSSGGSSGSGSTGPMMACVDQYGMAPGFMLCMETADECRFNADLGGMDCNAVCQTYGGTCITAFDNDVDPCVELVEAGCAAMTMSEICVCTKN